MNGSPGSSRIKTSSAKQDSERLKRVLLSVIGFKLYRWRRIRREDPFGCCVCWGKCFRVSGVEFGLNLIRFLFFSPSSALSERSITFCRGFKIKAGRKNDTTHFEDGSRTWKWQTFCVYVSQSNKVIKIMQIFLISLKAFLFFQSRFWLVSATILSFNLVGKIYASQEKGVFRPSSPAITTSTPQDIALTK